MPKYQNRRRKTDNKGKAFDDNKRKWKRKRLTNRSENADTRKPHTNQKYPQKQKIYSTGRGRGRGRGRASDHNYNRKHIQQKCIQLFGSKRKANKFVKKAITHGIQIRSTKKSNFLRYNCDGYQLLLESNDIKKNKMLGIKSVIHIEYNTNHATLTSAKQKHEQQITANNNFKTATKYPCLYPSGFELQSDDRILILGEMDFSFALDIAHKLGGKNVVATAYYKRSLAAKQAMKNVHVLKELKATVLWSVDATNLKLESDQGLSNYCHRNGDSDSNHEIRFDKILFAFPRYSKCPNSEKFNIQFMRKVFENVSKCLATPDRNGNGGQFQVLLHINQSGHSPKHAWKLDYPEWECVCEQLFTQKEVQKMFALYKSRDGNGQEWLPYQTGLYVFQLHSVQNVV